MVSNTMVIKHGCCACQSVLALHCFFTSLPCHVIVVAVDKLVVMPGGYAHVVSMFDCGYVWCRRGTGTNTDRWQIGPHKPFLSMTVVLLGHEHIWCYDLTSRYRSHAPCGC